MDFRFGLSIRQPWAWLIINGHKDIENRRWSTNICERVFIHASKGMTRQEYSDCVAFTSAIDKSIIIPEPKELLRGGIIGTVEITACVSESSSIWFTGEYGFVLRNPQILPFQECKGALGFFHPLV